MLDRIPSKFRGTVYACLSGLCAAGSGLFSKLITDETTSRFAAWLAPALSDKGARAFALFIRALCVGINIALNLTMWMLYTASLALASAAANVTIVDTTVNFLITTVLGFLVFSERPNWMLALGILLLISGNIVLVHSEIGKSIIEQRLGPDEPIVAEFESSDRSTSSLVIDDDIDTARHYRDDMEMNGEELPAYPTSRSAEINNTTINDVDVKIQQSQIPKSAPKLRSSISNPPSPTVGNHYKRQRGTANDSNLSSLISSPTAEEQASINRRESRTDLPEPAINHNNNNNNQSGDVAPEYANYHADDSRESEFGNPLSPISSVTPNAKQRD